MFEVGFSEIVLIFGLALVVLGPEKLPKLASTVGRWVGRARAMARQFRDQLETEAESLKSTVNEAGGGVQSSIAELEQSLSAVGREVEQTGQQIDLELTQPPPGPAADAEQPDNGPHEHRP